MISFSEINFSYNSRQQTLVDINFEVSAGTNIGIVGESGSGKSTLMKIALGLYKPQSGQILFSGHRVNFEDREFSRRYRRSVQAVFQDPYSSLDPKQRIVGTVAEPLISLGLIQGKSKEWVESQVIDMLQAVGLDSGALTKYPHQFSGGERQRIAIARAVISRPSLLLADEPVSSLDVTNRELVLDLLKKLRNEYGLTIAVISHDLSVIATLCEETVVLEHGRVIEQGATSAVLGAPSEPYTQKLLRAVPRLPAM